MLGARADVGRGPARRDPDANKDLSREGLVKAFRELKEVDTQGLVSGNLDFSKVGQASSKSVYAHDVDKDADGGLKTVGDVLSYDTAQEYERKPGT